MRSDSLIVVTTGRGMVDALTSYVVDGQTKWTVMSERKEGNNGEKSQQREKSHKCNNCSLTRDLSSLTCRHTWERTTHRSSSNATNAVMRQIRKNP